MAWRIEFAESADKALGRLDRPVRLRVIEYLRERLGRLEDPRSTGDPLVGPRFGELWRYRVGDYRLICRLEDQKLLILVVRIGHRREIYR